MLIAAARRRVAALRQPVPAARVARALWMVWAVIVWNVVFDHVIVVAGRSYISAATRAANAPRPDARPLPNPPFLHPPFLHPPFLNMDDWMRPAVTRGLWIATAAGAAILLTGWVAVRVAARDEQPLLTHR
jgi:hypothetical protein